MARIVFATAIALAVANSMSLADDKDVCRIGIPRSIFRDVPPALLAFAGQPFNDIMKAQSGLNGEVVHKPDAMTVARELDAGKLQLGVFFGHEFAWAKKKYAKLEPLVCTIPQPKEIQAYVLVSYYSKATNLGDLRDMKLALAKTTRDHARLFLDKRRAEEMGGGNFASTLKTDTVHDAIERLIEGEADVTVADSASWRHYQSLYPGRSQNVRELTGSDVFPPTVIACKKGALDEATIKSIQQGLLGAHKNPKAARLMNLIKVERFDAIPDNYDAALKACLKAYPKPLADK